MFSIAERDDELEDEDSPGDQPLKVRAQTTVPCVEQNDETPIKEFK